MTVGQRFARFVTTAVVRRPRLWRLLRPATRLQFDRLAPLWNARRSAGFLASLEAALDLLPEEPGRVLDVGTGTGAAAFAAARRWPHARVVGVDLSRRMVEEARRLTPPELAERVRFEQADAESLPYPAASFDAVLLANAIPFFDELARVVAPGGHVVFGFSAGPETPIYVPPERLRAELAPRGFGAFREVSEGQGTAFLAVRGTSE